MQSHARHTFAWAAWAVHSNVCGQLASLPPSPDGRRPAPNRCAEVFGEAARGEGDT